jgi:hypothetical protein
VSTAGEPGIAVQDLAYVGLDSLRAMVPLDLCAYLHVSAAQAPQLYLRAPDLSALDPTAAFDLFSVLRDVLATAEPGVRRIQVTSFQSVAVLTAGESSRGLFVLGRTEDPLTDDEERLAAGLCRAVGIAAHAVETSARPAVEGGPLKVSVQVLDGVAHAEVVLPVSGELRTGVGDGPSPTDAVARATLEALGGGLKLVNVTEGEVGGERVIVALVRSSAEEAASGAALAGSDALHATAIAAADAASKLRR